VMHILLMGSHSCGYLDTGIYFYFMLLPLHSTMGVMEHQQAPPRIAQSEVQKVSTIMLEMASQTPLCPNPLNLPQATSMKCPVA
jgi:hypothetical protein